MNLGEWPFCGSRSLCLEHMVLRRAVRRKGLLEGVSRRCLERPLREYAPFGVHPLFISYWISVSLRQEYLSMILWGATVCFGRDTLMGGMLLGEQVSECFLHTYKYIPQALRHVQGSLSDGHASEGLVRTYSEDFGPLQQIL